MPIDWSPGTEPAKPAEQVGLTGLRRQAENVRNGACSSCPQGRTDATPRRTVEGDVAMFERLVEELDDPPSPEQLRL